MENDSIRVEIWQDESPTSTGGINSPNRECIRVHRYVFIHKLQGAVLTRRSDKIPGSTQTVRE